MNTTRRVLLSSIVAAPLALMLLGGAPGTVQDEETVLIGAAIINTQGELERDRAVVIRNGRIARIDDASRYDGAAGSNIIRHPGAVIAPGLIDVVSQLGVAGDSVANVASIDPSVSIVEAVDGGARDLREALQAGVTSAMIVPAPTNLVSGAAAAVRTDARAGDVDVLDADGPLVFSLGEQAFSAQRAPSSRSGALFMLRNLLDDSDAARPRVRQVVAGERAALTVCGDIADVDAAMRVFAEYGVEPVIVHSESARELAEGMEGESITVVVGPYTLDTSPGELAGAAALHVAGARVAFAGGLGGRDAHHLRLTAALAVRYGMDAAAARRAMTSEPARVAGLDDRIGALRAGFDADIVVFSGDPLRADSSVMEVWTRGRRAYAAAQHHVSHGRRHHGTQ